MQNLSVVMLGMVMVFAVLILLWGIILLFKIIFSFSKKLEKSETVTEKPEQIELKQSKIDNDDELIAVITAAIAASSNNSTYNLKIKSYKKVSNSSPVWNQMGRKEQILNKL